jgi:hypothetical protein
MDAGAAVEQGRPNALAERRSTGLARQEDVEAAIAQCSRQAFGLRRLASAVRAVDGEESARRGPVDSRPGRPGRLGSWPPVQRQGRASSG